MTPKQISALRGALEENTKTFGARFLVSGRTVEDWEQGRSAPRGLTALALDTLAREIRKARRSA
jgi:DNA-binding transcriptional regulator YiaG